MLPALHGHQSVPAELRVGLVSPDESLAAILADTFEVERLSLRSMLREPQRVVVDVLLIDARHQNHVMPVSRLVAEGTFGVVVVARPQDSLDAMKYLDVGALDVIWDGTPEAAVRARIRSAARHARPVSAEWLSLQDLAFSRTRREVRRGGERIRLTPTEYRLLEALVEGEGRTLSHREIITKVWGTGTDSGRHHLRVYVRQVREKIERDPSSPAILLTEPGVGYRLGGAHRPARAV